MASRNSIAGGGSDPRFWGMSAYAELRSSYWEKSSGPWVNPQGIKEGSEAFGSRAFGMEKEQWLFPN